MHVLLYKKIMLMLFTLTKITEGMIPILTPIMKVGETTLTLGMAISLIHLVLTNPLVNLLVKIGPISSYNKSSRKWMIGSKFWRQLLSRFKRNRLQLISWSATCRIKCKIDYHLSLTLTLRRMLVP